MSDILKWLESLRLGQYASAFEEGDIDLEILPELDRDVLKELGVKSPGHQLRILKAIASLSEDIKSKPDLKNLSSGEHPGSEAERRHLTVMFCDLVGSTALSASLDPEEMREIILSYQQTVTREIKRYDGHVAKYMGDGVMVYFGYPHAHEDDAERATFAALAIIAAVRALEKNDSPPLDARVGIATGNVVIGDIIGEGISKEHAVVGDAPNLAARLESFAEPGTVAISSTTQRLIGDLFELKDLGEHSLKGIPNLVRIWRPTAESQAENRFLAKRGSELSQMVGRGAELELIASRWEDVVCSEGQLILLSGEAGIGKSRIIEAFAQRVGSSPHKLLRLYCTPYHTTSALHPVIVHLLRGARISSHDSADEKLAKLESFFDSSLTRSESWLPVIADLLSIQSVGEGESAVLTPLEKKAVTFDILLSQIKNFASKQPVLLILEDAQWLDPTTTELFSRIIERLQDLSVLLLVTSRPGFESPWTNLAVPCTSLTLARLGRTQTQEIINRLTGGKPLPVAVFEQILTKTDGVPLFVEELTKSVLESDVLVEREDRFDLVRSIGTLAIPDTLHDSLMSRLDRDRSVREVAQIGSVIGREFSYELIDHVTTMETLVLEEALNQVVEVELASSRGRPPRSIYTFKHALVQETAYQSLLKDKRRSIHFLIAEALENHFLDRGAVEPEVLAHHFTMADRSDSAVNYWLAAGERSLGLSASVEAINHFRQGLSQLVKLPESTERDCRELSMQLGHGGALMSVDGQGAASTGEAYARARLLGKSAGDSARYFQALYGCWRYHFIRSELPLAQKLGEECVQLTESGNDPGAVIGSNFALGGTLVFTGRFADARACLEQAIAAEPSESGSSLSVKYGQEPGLSSRSYLSWVLWFQGELNQSLSLGEEALSRARILSHAHTLAQVSNYLSMTHCMFRDWNAAQKQARETMILSEKHEFPQTYWLAAMVNGRVMVEQGRTNEGIALIEQGIAERRVIGVEVGQSFWISLLAESYMLVQEYDMAVNVLSEALQYAARSGDQFYLPEIHRILGETILLSNTKSSSSEPEQCFNRALDLARQQGSKSLELRTATSLAGL